MSIRSNRFNSYFVRACCFHEKWLSDSASLRGHPVSVSDLEHTESQSLSGIGVVKYFFQPNASEELPYAQITATSQTGLTFAPPGTTAPYILSYNAATVPVLQLALSSGELSEAKIFDLRQNVLRVRLASVPGVTMPWPYGGVQGQVQVDLDPDAFAGPARHPGRRLQCGGQPAILENRSCHDGGSRQ